MAKKEKSFMKGAAIVAAFASAMALARFLSKNRKTKRFKTAAKDMTEHAIAHAKKLGSFSRASYDKIVDAVVAEYGNMKTLSKKEVKALSNELKVSWKDAQKALKKKK